jgi:two-component sensor histidine kinase
MNPPTDEVTKLLQQQAAIAGFGSFALRQGDLMLILNEAARVCAEGLNVPFSKVCRYRLQENDLLVEAGYGWHPGVVGHVVSRADESSPQGRAFITGLPSICADLGKDNVFELPGFYAEHAIVSTIDVVIKGDGRPYGVLEIDNDQLHEYDQHDIDFLTAFANVLAEAVATSARTLTLQTKIEEITALVAEKDRLIDQKNVMAEELQHRVRNNLQLVHGMLNKQLAESTDKASRQGIKAIAGRVLTLAQVYEHLLGSEMTRTIDFGKYITSLCSSLEEIQSTPTGNIKLHCSSDSIMLDLDVVTVLGLVVVELVTNSYEHAFPDKGPGTITVSVANPTDTGGMATLTIGDDGRGFEAGAESKRHGVGLVRRLIGQVNGTVACTSDHGTAWTIGFPVAEALAAA